MSWKNIAWLFGGHNGDVLVTDEGRMFGESKPGIFMNFVLGV